MIFGPRQIAAPSAGVKSRLFRLDLIFCSYYSCPFVSFVDNSSSVRQADHWIKIPTISKLIPVQPGPLTGKSIVIVGGTTGLGLSAALACVAAGAKVVAVGRNRESAVEAGEAL